LIGPESIRFAKEISVSMSATTREHLTATHMRDEVELPSHLEPYFCQALLGRLLTKGTGFSCPVFGISHTFRIHDIKSYDFVNATTAAAAAAAAPAAAAAGETKHKDQSTSTVKEQQQNEYDTFTFTKLFRVGNETKIRLCRQGEDQDNDEVTRITTTPSSPKKRLQTSSSLATTFDHIGGLATQIATVRDMIHRPLHTPELFITLGLTPPKGVLMFGPPGTGKTMIARAVSSASNATFLRINGSELLTDVVGASEASLRRIFARAVDVQPTVIFIDEIDALCPRRDRSTDEVDKRMVSTLLTLMDGVGELSSSSTTTTTTTNNNISSSTSSPPPRVVVLAATNRPNALDPALRRPGRFDREIEIGVPTEEGRLDILTKLLAHVPHHVLPAELQQLAGRAHGFVGADLASVVREAGLVALKRSFSTTTTTTTTTFSSKQDSTIDSNVLLVSCPVTCADLSAAVSRARPSALREVAVEVPKVQWTDIGGQEHVKQRLKEAVEWPLKRPEIFARMGIRPPKGVLLYGPPGCSKTMMAKAVATESGMNFLAVKGPELFNKYVGASEKAVSDLFRRARAAAPSIIFFDEIDALASQRGGGGGESGGGVADRVLSQLLTELDGIRPLKQVVVLAATNRPDLVDGALTRPGRIDRMLYVSPPDLPARVEILQIHTRNTPLHEDVNVVTIAEQTQGLSGAELAALCREASMHAMERDEQAMDVRMTDFLNALLDVKPRTTKGMLKFYESFGQ